MGPNQTQKPRDWRRLKPLPCPSTDPRGEGVATGSELRRRDPVGAKEPGELGRAYYAGRWLEARFLFPPILLSELV